MHTGYDHFISPTLQIQILMAKQSGGIVIHACDRTFAALLMTFKLWESKFACFCVSKESIEIGSAFEDLHGTFNRPSKRGIENCITMYNTKLARVESLSSIIRNNSLDFRDFEKTIKRARYCIGSLSMIDFLVLIPLMNQHPDFKKWEADGYVNHPTPAFGFDIGGFCIPVLKNASKNRRDYEFNYESMKVNNFETPEGES